MGMSEMYVHLLNKMIISDIAFGSYVMHDLVCQTHLATSEENKHWDFFIIFSNLQC